ncbi:MAG: chalcone isomerase family protein [Gammaproteobacteria bacterium]|nr:chalcone isomerase family protein [Gammaproteobacteria bacterium]
MFLKRSLFLFLLISSSASQATELAGVEIAQSVMLADQRLTLNGAGVRTKFIFDIYVAAFYSADAVKKNADINLQQPMRMAMHFVYDEVDKDKLTDAWIEGFEENLSATLLKQLDEKIKRFNGYFETVHKGDVIRLDYYPNKGTQVSINNRDKGLIEGASFYRALLLIWLGKEPVAEELKQQLLGN